MSTFRKVAGVVGVLVLGGAAAVATGAIPDSDDGEVHVCYTNKTTYNSDDTAIPAGTPRIIDYEAGRRCKSNETHLVINQQGPAGATNVVTRYGPAVSIQDSTGNGSYAECEEGESVTGGGYQFPSPPVNTNYRIDANRASIVVQNPPDVFYPPPPDGGEATGWFVYVENNTGSDVLTVQAYVQCASP